MSTDVMRPSVVYCTAADPHTSVPPPNRKLMPELGGLPTKANATPPPPNRKLMPALGGLPTKANVPAPPVAAVHAVTSSSRAMPFVNTGIGRLAHRTVRPSLNRALSWISSAVSDPDGPLGLFWLPWPPQLVKPMAKASLRPQ